MDPKISVLKTCAYASYFDFVLFPKEIHHWLVTPKKVSYSNVQELLGSKLTIGEKIKRRNRSFSSLNKIKIAKKLGRMITWIPGIQLMALTGSVAAGNSLPGDDIDLLIITSPHVLWILRPLVLLLISLFFRRRLPHEDPSRTKDAFCPNLWLDLQSLTLPSSNRNLYTAHEILQIIPVVDKNNTYFRFLTLNSWVKTFLANSYYEKINSGSIQKSGNKQSVLDLLFLPVNILFYLIQRLYMFPKKTTEKVHLHAAFLHTQNYSDNLQKHLSSFLDI